MCQWNPTEYKEANSPQISRHGGFDKKYRH